ncbi:MAG: hypothetical protein Fur0024_3540 [Patescibacteria group bacterium]
MGETVIDRIAENQKIISDLEERILKKFPKKNLGQNKINEAKEKSRDRRTGAMNTEKYIKFLKQIIEED